MSSLADTYHSNPVRLPSVSVSVRNASRCLSDSRTGVCPMAGRDAGGFGSIHKFGLDGVMGYFGVVLHPLNTIHGQPLFHTEKDSCLHGVCSRCGLRPFFSSQGAVVAGYPIHGREAPCRMSSTVSRYAGMQRVPLGNEHSTAGTGRGQTVPYTEPDNCHSV